MPRMVIDTVVEDRQVGLTPVRVVVVTPDALGHSFMTDGPAHRWERLEEVIRSFMGLLAIESRQAEVIDKNPERV